MKNKWFAAVAVLLLGMLSLLPFTEANAANYREQGIHFKEGVSCADCHKVEKPKDAAPYKTCLDCHSPYSKLAQRTK